MEDAKFDALVKRLVDESTRRTVLRGAAGTALASALAVAGMEAVDAKPGKAKQGKGKDKSKGKGKTPIKPAGPCGNGGVPANKCRVQSPDGFSNDCCTNYCRKTNRKHRPKNSPPPHDPNGRCRLAPNGFPCTQSQFCASGYCAMVTAQQDSEVGECVPYGPPPELKKSKKHRSGGKK